MIRDPLFVCSFCSSASFYFMLPLFPLLVPPLSLCGTRTVISIVTMVLCWIGMLTSLCCLLALVALLPQWNRCGLLHVH